MGRLRLNFPGRSYVGSGCIEALGEEAARLGSRALVVTGRGALKAAGVTRRLSELLQGSGVDAVLFDQAPPEPDLATVDEARRRIRDEGCDVVVEAGGGSAMDVGKAAAGLAHESAPTSAYFQGQEIAGPGLPHIAVATTSGTGAEVTRNSVLTDPRSGLKRSIRGDGLMPTVSFTDPELTLACPPEVTAASGMDALAQAIESFLSMHAVPETEALSLAAVEIVVSSLPVAFRQGDNIEAREAMAHGSYMAGLALGSARLGAVHGLAHPLGLIYGIGHGVVCSVLLPHVLERNRRGASEKYERLRRAMGGDPVQVVEGLLDELDIPHRLGAYPSEEQERMVMDYALTSGSSCANPVPVDEDYVRGVLARVCSG